MKLSGFLLAAASMTCGVIAQEDTAKADSAQPVIVKDADGNSYHTVRIGNQLWTMENWRSTKFNDGAPIPHVDSIDEWYTRATPAYCSYENTADARAISKFGLLYNWHAVNSGKLAPKGWHVPKDNEVDTLQDFLIACNYNWDESGKTNKIAKSLAATTDWVQEATKIGVIGNDMRSNNRTGFSALPAGYLDDFGGFAGQNLYGCWWTATEAEIASMARNFILFTGNEALGRKAKKKYCGLSVRLVKD